MIDIDRFKELANRGDWLSLHAMLDDARETATSRDDARNEVHWRVAALEQQERHDEALHILKTNAHLYNSQCLARHKAARLLLRLGRKPEALDELSQAPFEVEMTSFYALAIDAKFFHLYLLAQDGDPSVVDRLSEIPDDYQHVTRDGTFLTKAHIVNEATKPAAAD